MTENLTITTERVDDIPLLLAQMKQMDLPNLLDSYFAIHGNWAGLDAGWTATLWLAHILSQADHRLSYVQPWAARCLFTLQQASGQPVRALDFTDDRLAALLRYFSADEPWAFTRPARPSNSRQKPPATTFSSQGEFQTKCIAQAPAKASTASVMRRARGTSGRLTR